MANRATQKRHLSPVLWAAFVGLLGFIFNNWNLWQYLGLDNTSFQTLAGLLSTILVALGIINDPTNKAGL
jgi:uncharacterized membrane protein